jgi:cytidine deaminase
MQKKINEFSYEVFSSIDELTEADKNLLNKARNDTQFSYAPYSNFCVSAVALMNNGEMVAGTNQENASYPTGLCAERVLLSAVSSIFPNEVIDTIAISYFNKNGSSAKPISPCGVCRQTLAEYEQRNKKPIRLILSGNDGEVIILKKATDLLPLTFSSSDMI